MGKQEIIALDEAYKRNKRLFNAKQSKMKDPAPNNSTPYDSISMFHRIKRFFMELDELFFG